MKPRSIVVMTGNHLCHNPRAWKEADALARAGFDVEVLGAWTIPALKERDRQLLSEAPFRFTPVVDLTATGVTGRIRKLLYRLRTRLAQEVFRLTGLQSRWQLGPAPGPLLRAAASRGGDLYIAHSEAALVAARSLAESGRRVSVDMEDWFSEDLSPDERRSRPLALLRELESNLLRRGAMSTSPSKAMSRELGAAYRCPEPGVLYNAFRLSDRAAADGRSLDKRGRRAPSVYWFSQSLGPGRGLEDLFVALPSLPAAVEIHLRGAPVAGFEAWFNASVPAALRERVVVHEIVPNGALVSRMMEHDIGFAGEPPSPKNKDLTVSNKILHYMLSGLAVVASETAGQREVQSQSNGAVRLYRSGDVPSLVNALNSLLNCPEELARAKAAALEAAETTFCWERQEPALVGMVKRALEAPSA